MRLTQKKNVTIPIFGILLFLFISSPVYSISDKINSIESKGVTSDSLILSARKHYNNNLFNIAIGNYQKALEKKTKDSIIVFRELAFTYANVDEPELASQYIEKYVIASLDVSFVNHNYFNQIKNSESFQFLEDKYLKKVGLWSIFCFYVAFIGFFIAVVLNFREHSDRVSNLLISVFVLIHSVFIIHIGLYFSNYEYYQPHVLYMSTMFSFLYGPLFYFYFKRVTIKRKFRLSDIWHLVPSFLLLILLFPIYALSAEQKLYITLHGERPHMILISISKLISLIVYGTLVIKIFIQYIKNNKYLSREVYIWQRNIVIVCSVYIVSYGIYSVLIIKHVFSGFLFYSQVTSMALLVLYVSYTAFVRPSVFGNLRLIKNRIKPETNKYRKSGLTESLSLELKEKLLYLLDQEKIYKQNDITLQKLAESLDTTRHNTSQIINEHFNLNFFELINKFRIEEAKELLKGEKHKNFNIIDVAYEVGFNNKVTFNKSFKKYNQITPSEYVKSFVA
ncbi:helix-turn-helix domain-containing protein [Aquimarina sp. 2201CG14-23]|uniref:helix-turn-helix domain-containing protein n=1 Tax=Aquimarina mycalae TaxID=3040073 RepID=UPI00247801C4|nr:helix-turn-helix transcriptional regulator [Aquimarina sp. 2201CG14-23]MDH7447023.1 helix-turn-helix transcriptional regulator [Aquimarina sp. 2201CG14-23]